MYVPLRSVHRSRVNSYSNLIYYSYLCDFLNNFDDVEDDFLHLRPDIAVYMTERRWAKPLLIP